MDGSEHHFTNWLKDTKNHSVFSKIPEIERYYGASRSHCRNPGGRFDYCLKGNAWARMGPARAL
jgi:hypothetical protein